MTGNTTTLEVSLDTDSYRKVLKTEYERHKALEAIKQAEAAERIRVPDDASLTLKDDFDAGFKKEAHRVERLLGERTQRGLRRPL